MPEALSNDKLQPCLLERLKDAHPERQHEGPAERIVNLARYRRAVIEDLQMLLSTARPEFESGLEKFPQVPSSVLNFGVRNLCGTVSASHDLYELAHDLREAIGWFEPRIDPDSLHVEAIVDHWKSSGNELSFVIHGDLWANPAPEELRLRTKLDLETGEYSLAEEKRP